MLLSPLILHHAGFSHKDRLVGVCIGGGLIVSFFGGCFPAIPGVPTPNPGILLCHLLAPLARALVALGNGNIFH